MVSYADFIVGMYEHSRGGHAWETGYIDQPAYRERTKAFYRTYETDAEQYAAYDGIFAHYLLSMDRVDRAQTWETTEELLEAVQRGTLKRNHDLPRPATVASSRPPYSELSPSSLRP